jgi:hypothetical protein
LALIVRQMRQAFLQEMDIKTSDGKQSDAASGTAGAAGNLAQERAVGPAEPVVGFAGKHRRERR